MSAIDELLAELTELRAALDRLPVDDPGRVELEVRRHELQRKARLLADTSRNPDYVKLELENLERRLAALKGTQIKPSLVEGHRWINDPSAYSRKINRQLEENAEDEVAAVEARIAELRQALGLPPPPSSRSAE